MNENEVLRLDIGRNERLLMKVTTGPNGTLVYDQVSLKSGHPVKNKRSRSLVGRIKQGCARLCHSFSGFSSDSGDLVGRYTFLHRP